MQLGKEFVYQLENSGNKYKSYIDNLPLSSTIKDSLCSGLDKRSGYYLFYPHLFRGAFNVEVSKKLDLLCIAGFLFYRSLLYLDKIVDSQVAQKNINQYLQLSFICQEESIKILATLFPLDSTFWTLWNKRKKEYLEAQELEKKDIVNESYFYTIADFKSAFGKIAIDSLATLAHHELNSDAYNAMLMAHKHFSIARQMYDDVIDIKEDVINKQSNYAIYKLKIECEQQGINFDSLDEVYLEKYAYVLGVSEAILKEAILNFETAVNISKPFIGNSTLWVDANNIHIYLTKTTLIKQTSYLKQIQSKAELSNQKYGKVLHLNEVEIENRINLALRYLAKKLFADGFWEEYLNSAGASSIWATAFIYSFIYNTKNIDNFILLDKIKEYLIDKQNLGFRYNEIAPTDGDSTNFGILSLHSMGINVSQYLGSLMKYQTSDGGFATYHMDDRESLNALMNFDHIEKFDSWEESHNCVSAVSFYLLSHLRKSFEIENHYQLLKSFILSRQKNSVWDSYWWTSPIYATSFIIKAISESKDADLIPVRNAAIESLLHQQNKNGSWRDSFQTESAFYTGLMANSILSSSLSTRRRQVQKSIEWIIENQNDDGSWPETNAMRLPSFKISNPNEVKSWPDRRSGLNVRAIEFNRLFSTSVCLSALNAYGRSEF